MITHYEYRVRYGVDGRAETAWSEEPITAEELEEWRTDVLDPWVERREVSIAYGEPEKYTP
jgi:hypothetical protein